MNCCAQSGTSACACGTIPFPQIVCNAANLPAIGYRVGDYVAFRHRLLQALPNEAALAAWRPGAEGDLAVQMMEWWAYLADILTFYNERIANEAYLATALLPESVNHLVQLLGYRPRPALGSRVKLAGLLSVGARVPVTVPQGLQVQSKPGPGQQPQVFELDAQTALQSPDAISAIAVPANAPLLGTDGRSVWLAGKVTAVKAGDLLLLANATAIAAQTLCDYAWISVGGVSPQKDPLGNAVTQVRFTVISGTLMNNAQAKNYVLLRSTQSLPLWSYPKPTPVIADSFADLAGVARGLTAGSLVLFDISSNAGGVAVTAAANAAETTQQPQLPVAAVGAEMVAAHPNPARAANALDASNAVVAQEDDTQRQAHDAASARALAGADAAPVPTPVIVTSYAEFVWYANGYGMTPPSPPEPPVPILHTEISFSGLSGPWSHFAQQVTVRFSFMPVGQIVPVLTAADLVYDGGAAALLPAPGAPAFPPSAAPVLLEDPSRGGASAVATAAPVPAGAVALGQLSALPAGGLASPIDVLFNPMPFSRGKTVPAEVLGSGNPAIAGQDFTLSKSPVTYFADSASVSGEGFTSTVKVSVNGVLWQEVQSFYGHTPDAQVFVTYEDDNGSTHVTFGDGVNGARLPRGTNNVVATYRYGAGALAPVADTLTVVQTPTPGLKGVRNPLPPTGGTDADSPGKLASLAPASVLTFDRAVSLDDYAAIAARAAGVTQAVADYVFDPIAQRPMVTLWIAGDANAPAQAAAALAGIAMPNQGFRITPAKPIEVTLKLTYLRDPRFDDATVQAALTAALLNPDTGLFRAGVPGIGEAVYESRISQACLKVPGVTAIHAVTLNPAKRFILLLLRRTPSRLARYGQPAATAPCSGQRFDPGAGNYFYLPNDGQHLDLASAGAVAS